MDHGTSLDRLSGQSLSSSREKKHQSENFGGHVVKHFPTWISARLKMRIVCSSKQEAEGVDDSSDWSGSPVVLYAFPVPPMVGFARKSEHSSQEPRDLQTIHRSGPTLCNLWSSSDAATRRGLASDASRRDSST